MYTIRGVSQPRALRLAIPLMAADFRQPCMTFMPYIIDFLVCEMHVVLDERTKEDISTRFLRARKVTVLTVLFNSKQRITAVNRINFVHRSEIQ